MDKTQDIYSPIENEMKIFNRLYNEALESNNSPDFQSMIDYISQSHGKRIRPIILLLVAQICGKANDKSINYAVILELLHNATLIHDDVVDDTQERRGMPSINANYGNKLAVLLGDYVLSVAIIKAVEAKSIHILNIISQVALNLVKGELSQLAYSQEKIIDEDHYYSVIKKKTAMLIASCAEIGALSVGVDSKTASEFKKFGEYLGICFQIRDDIFDYFDKGKIGKPTGNDIREGKITLPLIYALKNATKEQSAPMLRIINNKDFSIENIFLLTEFAKAQGGIEYAEKQMHLIKINAIKFLETYPDSESKTALIKLMEYIIERDK